MSESEILTPNPPGKAAKKSTADAPQRAVVAGDVGYHGEPVTLGDVTFYLQRAEKSALRHFSKETRRIPREIELLAKAQKAELEALQEEDADATLGEDRWDHYEDEGERLADELDAAYNALLSAGVFAWSRPEPFDPALLEALEDKQELCNEIGSRSVSGFSTIKNSRGRSTN